MAHPRRFRFAVQIDRASDRSSYLELVRKAEDLGYDTLVLEDHFDENFAPIPAMLAAASATSSLRVSTHVFCNDYKHPLVLAKEIATLDVLTDGRVEFGLGAGWFEAEHAAYGIPFPPLGERFDVLEEQLAIITGLWGTPEGETFSFDGAHYRVSDSPGLPKPAQRPRPPVDLGGGGARRTPRLAARFADEFNVPFRSLADSAAGFARVREACEAAGRYPASMTYSVAQTVCCGKDEAEFRRRAAAIGEDPEDLRANAIGGTPSEVAAKIAEFAEIGADRVYLQVLDLHDLGHLELLASDVLPQV